MKCLPPAPLCGELISVNLIWKGYLREGLNVYLHRVDGVAPPQDITDLFPTLLPGPNPSAPVGTWAIHAASMDYNVLSCGSEVLVHLEQYDLLEHRLVRVDLDSNCRVVHPPVTVTTSAICKLALLPGRWMLFSPGILWVLDSATGELLLKRIFSAAEAEGDNGNLVAIPSCGIALFNPSPTAVWSINPYTLECICRVRSSHICNMLSDGSLNLGMHVMFERDRAFRARFMMRRVSCAGAGAGPENKELLWETLRYDSTSWRTSSCSTLTSCWRMVTRHWVSRGEINKNKSKDNVEINTMEPVKTLVPLEYLADTQAPVSNLFPISVAGGDGRKYDLIFRPTLELALRQEKSAWERPLPFEDRFRPLDCNLPTGEMLVGEQCGRSIAVVDSNLTSRATVATTWTQTFPYHPRQLSAHWKVVYIPPIRDIVLAAYLPTFPVIFPPVLAAIVIDYTVI